MTRVTQHTSLPYRPAIDGLRAFAVLSVIAYHVYPASAPGGWFGVDIFFVISGFLITSLLLAEYRARHGRIDLVGFWLARARRLLPALFAVLTAVLVASLFLTLPGRRSAVAGDILATLLYAANWRFVFGDEAYFGQVASPSPLRHAWSLAVEEQFYLVYPLVLLGLLALTRRRSTLVWVLAGLAAISAVLMASLHVSGLDPSRVYYGTDTRVHQLLVGAAVAAFLSGGPGSVSRSLVRTVDSACRRLAGPALLVVVSAFWWADQAQDVLFEGAIVPLSALVCVVLVACTSPSTSAVQQVLSWEPLRRVGLISYGLYLWHWPIVIFLNDQVLPIPTAALVLVQLALTAVLALLSYRFIERPVRKGGAAALLPRAPRAGTVIAWAMAPLLVAGALAMPSASGQIAVPGAGAGDVSVPDSAYRPAARMISVNFIGNSVPRSLITHFHSSNHPDLDLHDQTNIGCDPIPAPKYTDGAVQPEAEGCAAWRDGWATGVEADDPDVVVFFMAHTMVSDRMVDGRVATFGSTAWRNLVYDSLDRAHAASGQRPFVVMNLACHQMPTFSSEEIKRVNDKDYVTTLNKTAATWAARNDVPVIDEYSLLCSGDTFHDTINGVPLYEDSIHFTRDSAPIFWRWLAPRLQQVSAGQDPS